MARFQRPAKKIDFKSWTSILELNLETGVAGTFSGASLAFTGPATILRARGFVSARMDETQQAGDIMRVIFALGVISTDAFVLGPTAFPDPGGNPEYPWLWWGSMHLESHAAAAAQAYGISNQYMEVDTKAMRKMKPGESLVWIVQTAGPAGAPVTQITFGQTRVLIGV